MSELTVSSVGVVEATTSGDPNYLRFTLSLSAAESENVLVQYRLWSGIGLAGADVYDWNTGTQVIFAPGETSKVVSWRVSADAAVESDEAVVMEVFGIRGGAATLAGNAPVLRSTGWVLDDDGTGNKLALYTSNPLVVEGDTGTRNAVFELSLSRPATSPFTVNYATVDGAARDGQDYTATAGALTFAVGQSTATVSVPVLGDGLAEPSDTFTLAVTAPAAVSLVTSGQATILDDDAAAVVVSVAGASNFEGTTSGDPYYLSFAITLSEAATENVTVQYRLWSGTAQAGSDVYDWNSGEQVTFAPGETSKTVNWRISADNVAEPDEAVVLEVFSVRGGGAAMAGNAPVLRATGWVIDDDGTANKLALFASEPLVVEGDSGTRQANFEVSLSRPAPEAFTVQYTTVDGSGRAGQDYTATAGTLSFVKGQTTASVSVPVLSDTTVEPSDSFALAFTVPSTIAQASLGEATILDDDAAAVVVSVAGASNTEGTTSGDPYYLSFAITLSEAATENVTVQYRLWSGTAQAGSDVYDWNSGSQVTFAPGETSKTVNWRISADNVAEPDEAVVLEVFSVQGGGAAMAGNAPVLRATGWVIDDDGTANKLALFASQPLVVEGDTGTRQANFEVSLSRPAPAAFSMTYSTVDGSARAGQDYTATTGTLSFVAGQTTASVSVPVLGDTTSEPSDTFTLAFTTPSTIVQTSLGQATILDDDAGPVVVSVAGATNVEGTTSGDPNYLLFAITLSEAANESVTVGYRLLSGTAAAGSDVYDWNSGTQVSFAPGETSKTVAWRISADAQVETDEAVVLEVYGVSGAGVLAGNATVLRATGWVLDDDGTGNKLALYSLRPVMVEGDSGNRQANFDISLSRPATEAFAVTYTTVDGSARAGQDYVATNGTLNFVKGQISASVAVEVIGDTAPEPSDYFALAFETPTLIAATLIGEALILDDDAGTPVVTVTGGSNFEGTTSGDPNYLLFGITLSEAATAPVTVGYRLLSGTATAGADVYDWNSGVQVTFAAGETSKTVAWRISADAAIEADESVVLEVFSVTGGAALAGNATVLRATGWVLDEDGTGNKLGLFTSKPVIVEGDDGTRQANFEVSLSRPAPGPIDINYQTKDVTGQAGSDYVASSGTLHFVTGQTQSSVSVPVIGDTVVETSDIFLLAFDKPVEVAQASLGEALILDNDAGTPTVSITGASNVEGTTSGDPAYLSFGITLSAPATNAVTVTYQLLSGSGTAGTDAYNWNSGTQVTFAPGETSKTVSWRISADAIDEADEAVVMELTGVTGTARLADDVSATRATGWILDDDGTGNNLAIFAESSPIVEGVNGHNRDAAVVVRLSRPSDTAINLAYQTVAGTASAGSDFTAGSGTLNFSPLQTVAAVRVPVVGDAVNEADETFSVQFTPSAALASGSAGTVGTVTILDGDRLPPPARLSIEAGANAQLNEGSTLQRSVIVNDSEDNGSPGWSYSVNYGDGSAAVTGNTLTRNLDLSHRYADGNATHTVAVTMTDAAGETATDSFTVNVANVAPTVALSGAASVQAGQPYTLNVGAVTDPGTDTVSQYRINWGDGTPVQIVTSAGNVAHTYASAANRSISVTLVDEDGQHQTPSTVAVNVTAPAANLSLEAGSNTTLAEGNLFTRTISFTDGEDNGTAGWSYSIDYGDGSAAVTGTTLMRSLYLSHVYADGSATRTAAVTVTDVAGESVTDSFTVDVANVAPAIALSGVNTVVQDSAYVLNLGGVSDPGVDTISEYRIDWGDGSPIQVVVAADLPADRQLQHRFATAGANTVRVTLVDEDGVHTNAGSRSVAVERQPAFTTVLTLPDSLAPAKEGLATLRYTNALAQDQDAILVFVQSEAGLLLDPLTGEYRDSLLLIGRGDGVGAIEDDEQGVLNFNVRMANAPNSQTEVSVSIIEPGTALDLDDLGDALRPEFTTDAVWDRVYANFLQAIDDSTDGLIEELAENSAFFGALGASDTSALAAWAFELEQAGDFGSIAERMAPGSLGNGWAFVGDVRLDVSASGDVAWRGSTDLDALLSLSAGAAAQYTVSASVGISVGLNGAVGNGASANRPVFSQGIDGSFATSTAFDGELVRTAAGYEVRTSSGAVMQFDDDGSLLRMLSATGRATVVTHDGQGRISGFRQGDDNTLAITRDANGRPSALVDEHGQTTTLGFAMNGQLVSATGPAGSTAFGYASGGDLASVTPPGGPQTAFAYDSQGRLASIDVAREQRAELSYDTRGGYTWISAEGQELAVELAPGGVASKVEVGGTTTSELIYDASGKLAGAQLADGSTVTFEIDGQGRLLSVTDSTGATVRYAYDGDTTRPASFTDAGGSTRQFSYDANGRMIEATWTDGSTLQFDYDAAGQLTGFANRRGDESTYAYDANGRLVSRTDAGSEATYRYDSMGRTVEATHGTGSTEIGYDSANRVARIEYPDGRSLDYAYDAGGRRTAMTDQDGNVQRYTYDTAGRLATVSANGDQLVAYDYDADGRLTEEANGNGTVTQYSYDARGLLTAIVNLAPGGAESSAYRYSYDAAGQRVGAQTPHGDWVYGYDGAGQLTSAGFDVNAAGLADGLTDKSLVYHYDAAGNRTRVVEDGVATLYTSNALNQYTQVGTATYTYDASGNQTSKTVGGSTWSYGYNAANRLVQITDPDGVITQYVYDVFGNRSAVVEDGVRTEFLVDPFALGMGSPVAEYSGGQQVASYFYGLNAIGQGAASDIYYFEGDAVGSVTSVTSMNGTLANSYAYDPFGRQFLDHETVANKFKFNGLFGVEADVGNLVYMRNRFFDPDSGRFIAEDPLWLGGDTANFYRFANNDPLQWADPLGLEPYKLVKIGGSVNVAMPWGSASIGAGVFVDVQNRDLGIFFSGGDGGTGLGAGASLDAGYYLNGRKGFDGNSTSINIDTVIGGISYDVSGTIRDANVQMEGVTYSYGPGIGITLTPTSTWTGSLRDIGSWFSGRYQSISNWISSTHLFTAASDGDPHLRTFDGLSYEFQAAGEFVLARGTGLEIQTRQEPWGNSTSVSVNTAVALRLGDAVVGLYMGLANPVNINGQFVAIANGETVSVGGGSIYRDGTRYIVTNVAGDGVWANVGSTHINVRAFIHDDRGDDVAGLLGNHDGQSGNDLALADGTVLPHPVPVTALYGAYADSWRVTDDSSLFVYGAGASTGTYTNRNFPANIVTLEDLDPAVRAAAEQIAREAGLIEGTWAFNSAVFDVAVTGLRAFADTAATAPETNAPEPTPVVLQQAPVVVPDSAAAGEDTPIVIDVLANDSDPESDTLQLVAATDPNGGTVTILQGGRLQFVPAANFNGVTTLRYTVSDGQGNLVEGTVDVAVASVNDAPTAEVDQFNASQGQTLSVSAATGLLVNDQDPDGDTLTVTGHAAASHGTLQIDADGAFRYTPNAGFVGTEVVEYTVSDGTAFSTASLRIEVGNSAPQLTLTGAGAMDEGDDFVLSIEASDAEGGALGYSIDWGDGSAVQTLTAAELSATSGLVQHRYADDAARTVTVTATDAVGSSTTRSHSLTVNNVAPTIALSGAASVQAGQAFTLNLGAITDPGADTVSQYLINWGDGTPAQVVTSAGNVAHTYAAVASRTISVALVDEDGSHANPTTVAVNVTAPTPTLSLEAGANASVAEGSLFTRTINFSDGQDDGAAGWSYNIDYGDGSAAVTGTTTAPTLDLSHRYTDGATTRNVSVTLTDVAGQSVTDGFQVAVANVAPTIAFTGPATGQTNQPYTLNLSAVTDPGQDTPSGYRIDWGDGSTPTQVSARGNVQHVYATAGQYSVQVTVTDEDGSFVSPNTLRVDVAGNQATRSVTVGDAVVNQRITGQWAQAWSDEDVGISHTANASAAQVAWSAVRFDASLPTTLSGGDISSGDLGVSGQSVASSAVRQEIDGLEALRFAVDGAATSLHLSLSRLFARDDGTAMDEAGRVRLYDAAGALVDERLFQGTNAQGQLTLDIDATQAFSSVELSAGAMVNGQFQYGAYNGRAGFTDATGTHGSDFLVDWAEFELIVVGQPAQPA